ncbi:MAG: DUF1413 domain-containing protein [Lachnospiraceae bacterium]|nr:DUF1413 domain-containing protein [Lachnospiraceae bacterium]
MVSILLKKALSQTVNLVEGEEFMVKDLFLGFEWKRIPKKERLSLGTEFFSYINSSQNEYPIVEAGKTSSHKQKYRVIPAKFSVQEFFPFDDEDDED